MPADSVRAGASQGRTGRPRKSPPAPRRESPSVATCSMSSASRILLVACRSMESRASSRLMPRAVVRDRRSACGRRPRLPRDLRRAGVERVLDQFLEDGGGPVHHLARGDLVGHVVREECWMWRCSGMAERLIPLGSGQVERRLASTRGVDSRRGARRSSTGSRPRRRPCRSA